MTKVIIEIRGGCLAAVHSDKPIEYVLMDWDDIKEGGRDLEPSPADTVGEDMAGMYDYDELEREISGILRKYGY